VGRGRSQDRSGPLRGLAYVALTGLIGWMVVTALGGSDTPEFEADAPIVALPGVGELPPTDLAQFEGMVTGQRGRPVIVNVWASWCAPCRTETPLLQRAFEEYGDEVTILGVASKDGAADAMDFMDEFGLTYPNVLDVTGAIRTELGLSGFPTTYLIDKDGVLQHRITGGISEQRLVALIEEGLR
jgi:cytochrome c biogenesis protein CcmG/thiol:disulfide interchange protein DsbE